MNRKNRNRHRWESPNVRMSPDQKKQLVMDAVNSATPDEPLTLKGVAVRSGVPMDDVKFYCDTLLSQNIISVKMIPDSFYPQQKVRAFFKKL